MSFHTKHLVSCNYIRKGLHDKCIRVLNVLVKCNMDFAFGERNTLAEELEQENTCHKLIKSNPSYDNIKIG